VARHLTMADIGRGFGRRRATRWSAGSVLLVAGVLGTVAVLGGAAWALPGLTGSPGAGSAGVSVPGGRCTAPATRLTVAASADKAALLGSLAADYDATAPADPQGRCVEVTVTVKSSGAAQRALAKGWEDSDGPRPDVWSPSGTIWLPLLEQRLAEAGRPGLVQDPQQVPHLASSPLVIAMPRPMAQALGWPDRDIGWSDLLTLAKDRTGWGRFGHPEWGPFSLGKTNPNFSHAGLESTIAAYYAAVGRTSGLTQADIGSARTRTFVAGVEQSVVRYGDNTASFLSDWQQADDEGRALRYISAVLTEENLVPSYNEGNPTADPAKAGVHPAPKVPLVAIYPKEGTFVADHPYAVLSAPWVTEPKRAAAQSFLTYLLSPAVQQTFQRNHFRDAQGRPGPAAGPQSGVLPDRPTRVFEPPPALITDAVLDSWAQLRKTANVISLVDVSGSMDARLPGSDRSKLDAAKQAAIASLGLFTDHDEVGLWSFSSRSGSRAGYASLVDIGPMGSTIGTGTRRQRMTEALGGLTAGGRTGLYDAVAAGYRAVQGRWRSDRINALVLLTDGKNEITGGLGRDELLRLVGTEDGRPVRIITIAYGPDADQANLALIARATKGAAYLAPSPGDIPKIYSQALSNL
jgi:Ca-activated chloride channel homolog